MTPGFREQFTAGAPLLGTFVKTPSHAIVEVLGTTGLDFLVIDMEHAPIGAESRDRMLLAAQLVQMPALVRVPSPAAILAALDGGAAGVMVPHVSDAAQARAVVAACRFAGGARGYSPAGRAGNYGLRLQPDYIAAEDARVTVIAMIEDPEAVENIAAILAVPGLDGVFIGRGDLSCAMGMEATDPAVREAVARVLAAARTAGKPAMMLADPAQAAVFAAQGATAFLTASDQSFLRQAARAARAAFHPVLETTP